MSDGPYRHVGSETGTPNGDLLVEDVRQLLLVWASLFGDERTGNPALSGELRVLARAMKPHGDLTIRDLSALIANVGRQHTQATRGVSGKLRKELPDDMRALGSEQVKLILDDEQYLKKQIVDLGAIRFGIPRGKLNRLPRQGAIASIRAALDHEQSLAALDRQAHVAGSRRA